ncbi:MAG: tRNA epoxyqueuosine(34) reductase QueG [Puniceicoccaceae bacterium]|nr:MAG: tRNA epoxyqueuosine(34) reductase QueG [Puniceicoccaceae bacterium]
MAAAGGLKERLRAELAGLGFDVVRFGQVRPDAAGAERFRTWLARGWQAEMAWLGRGAEKRCDPRLVLPGALTAVVLGVNYLPAAGRPDGRGRWARYSLYSDYHDTMLRGLREAGRRLEALAGLGPEDHREYTDTGPLLERGLAAACGLGWQGKNGMLISREHGNWLLLGVMLARLDLEPDPPLRSGRGEVGGRPATGHLCGSCVRCIEICPTAAIPEPGLVDARRCISYHTIENRGIIPRELRPGIGGYVFGCDLCLEICPWNKFARAGRQVLLEAREEWAELRLAALLRLDDEAFRRIFRKSPVKRAKRAGLVRNACVVAGNLRDPAVADLWPEDSPESVREILAGLAGCDGAALVRAHAVWAVRRLWPEQALAWLAEAWEREADPAVCAEYEGPV